MRAVYSKPGEVLKGWNEALLGLRESPLPRYWWAQDQAVSAARPWYARGIGLYLFAAVLSAAVCIVIWLLNQRLASFPARSLTAHELAAVELGLVSAAASASVCLYLITLFLSRLHRAIFICLGFLEAQPRRVQRRSLDDLLAVARLSEMELLVGLLAYCLRSLLPPLCAVYFSATLFIVCLQATAGETRVNPMLLLSYLPVVLAACLGGALGTANSLLLSVVLSRSYRASLLPQLGSAMQIMLQAVSIPLLLATFSESAFLGLVFDRFGLAGSQLVVIGELFFLFLLVYTARRVTGLRFLLGSGPLIALGLFLVLPLASSILDGDHSGLASLLLLGLLAVQCCFCGVNPVLPKLLSEGSHEVFLFTISLIPQQLALLLVLAELARDAVLRRKWEGT